MTSLPRLSLLTLALCLSSTMLTGQSNGHATPKTVLVTAKFVQCDAKAATITVDDFKGEHHTFRCDAASRSLVAKLKPTGYVRLEFRPIGSMPLASISEATGSPCTCAPPPCATCATCPTHCAGTCPAGKRCQLVSGNYGFYCGCS